MKRTGGLDFVFFFSLLSLSGVCTVVDRICERQLPLDAVLDSVAGDIAANVRKVKRKKLLLFSFFLFRLLSPPSLLSSPVLLSPLSPSVFVDQSKLFSLLWSVPPRSFACVGVCTF